MRTNADPDVNTDTNASRDIEGEGDDTDGDSSHPTLAEYVREAAEDDDDALVERARASYDRAVSRRRVRRLLDIERERLDRLDGEATVTVAAHPPRYVDPGDLDSLTDAEFGRVVAYLLGEREGSTEVIAEAESVETEGVPLRWHRERGTVLVRALAAEPGRVIDAELVGRVRGTDSEHRTVDTAIVTVADTVPGATRVAVRSGVALYDRHAIGRLLRAVRVDTETFGSLLER